MLFEMELTIVISKVSDYCSGDEIAVAGNTAKMVCVANNPRGPTFPAGYEITHDRARSPLSRAAF